MVGKTLDPKITTKVFKRVGYSRGYSVPRGDRKGRWWRSSTLLPSTKNFAHYDRSTCPRVAYAQELPTTADDTYGQWAWRAIELSSDRRMGFSPVFSGRPLLRICASLLRLTRKRLDLKRAGDLWSLPLRNSPRQRGCEMACYTRWQIWKTDVTSHRKTELEAVKACLLYNSNITSRKLFVWLECILYSSGRDVPPKHPRAGRRVTHHLSRLEEDIHCRVQGTIPATLYLVYLWRAVTKIWWASLGTCLFLDWKDGIWIGVG